MPRALVLFVVVLLALDSGRRRFPPRLPRHGTPIWLAPGHRSARVTVSERVPAGQLLIDGGCHLNDIRSDGVQALIDPWDVPMRHGRISLTVDRWLRDAGFGMREPGCTTRRASATVHADAGVPCLPRHPRAAGARTAEGRHGGTAARR